MVDLDAINTLLRAKLSSPLIIGCPVTEHLLQQVAKEVHEVLKTHIPPPNFNILVSSNPDNDYALDVKITLDPIEFEIGLTPEADLGTVQP